MDVKDFILNELDRPLRLSDGSTATDAMGNALTKEQGMAVNVINKALKGDIESVRKVQNVKVTTRKKSHLTTFEEYMLKILASPIVKGVGTDGKPIFVRNDDGNVVTHEEGIAKNLVANALKGDRKALDYINELKQLQARLK